jgi:hypothetical protein
MSGGGSVHRSCAKVFQTDRGQSPEPAVYIDDERVREAIVDLLESHGLRAIAFGAAGDYIAAPRPDLPASLADLVRFAEKLQIPATRSRRMRGA